MPFSVHQQVVGLDDFLAALRVNGVPVGPAEVDRLRRLFALAPQLNRDGLNTLLSALLVKTPAQRETFEALFAEWCPDHDADWPEGDVWDAEVSTEQPTAPGRRPPEIPSFETVTGTEIEQRRRIWPWLLAAVGILLLGVLLARWWWAQPVEVVTPDGKTHPVVEVPPTTLSDPDTLHTQPVDTVWFWKADVDTDAIHAPWRLGSLEFLLLGLAALATAGAAWWRYRQQFPEGPPTSPEYIGYGWQPLPPPGRDDGELIDARDRRQLVWNIEHFISDDPTRRLDLPLTVDATAKAGGYVRLHFKPAAYDREIWFWLDRQLDRTTPRIAVQQLTATLAAGGLYAHQGWFTDVPDRVDWPEQRGYRPVHEEGHGRQALVAIFSDGEGLAHRLNNPLYRPATERLLRDLRRWPRLCFVDCSPSGARLEPLLKEFSLDVIGLDEVSHWLGGIETGLPSTAPLGSELYGDTRVWAAAVALGGGQVDTASAHSLRVALRLNASAWLVDQILAEARQVGNQTRHINWLLRCEALGATNMPQPGSLARRALRWWWQCYAAAAKRMQTQENPLLPWHRSLAKQRWELEQALLQLYLDPESAARQLAHLADKELADDIRDRLALFTAADQRPDEGHKDAACIVLTWRFGDLPAATRYTLYQLGFAAERFNKNAPTSQKYAPRLILAATILAMLALSAFGASVYHWFAPEPPRVVTDKPATYDHPAFRAQTVRVMERTLVGTYRIALGSARWSMVLPNVPEGAEIPVKWTWHAENNGTEIAGSNTVLLRAGRLAQPIRPCSEPWPQRSIMVIAAPYKEDVKARQLAIRLLDTGSADQVLIGTDWDQPLVDQLGSSSALNQDTQVFVVLPGPANAERAAAQLAGHPGPWAVVSSSDFAALAQAVKFAGSQTLDAVPPEFRKQLRVHRARGDVRLVGGPEKAQTDSKFGIEWVKVCPGTFTMGTVAQDGDLAVKMADTDEMLQDKEGTFKPPRTVILSRFDMAATETTQAQYVKIAPELGRKYDQDSMVPVVDINWEKAQTICRDAEGDLPTEAQWEYAARGGSRFPWSFGDDETLLKHYASYAENSRDTAGDVGQKRPNPLGLYDMHGNVWEWARDWYNEYVSGVEVDPSGPSSGDLRVVRGGSFDLSPVNLRSADRDDDDPENRGWNAGFRCARVPPS